MAVLPTGLAGTTAAQRLRCRFGQTVRARRLRGVLRRLPQPRLQLRDPHPRRAQLHRECLNQHVALRSRSHSSSTDGVPGTPRSSPSPTQRSSRHADHEDLTSYVRTRAARITTSAIGLRSAGGRAGGSSAGEYCLRFTRSTLLPANYQIGSP